MTEPEGAPGDVEPGESETDRHQARIHELDALFQGLQAEVRRQASRLMAGCAVSHTLQTTALMNEAYLKLALGRSDTGWRHQGHFMGEVTKAMRHILVDHARAKNALKRLPPGVKVALDEVLHGYETSEIDVIAVHEALERLDELEPEKVVIIDLQVFGGFAVKDIAKITRISMRTVERHLAEAKALLRGWLK